MTFAGVQLLRLSGWQSSAHVYVVSVQRKLLCRRATEPLRCAFRVNAETKKALAILGLNEDQFTQHSIKSAFRAKVKKFHPDVYEGIEDASAIVQKVIEAYEILIRQTPEENDICRNNVDPFDEPESSAKDIFINEFSCIGRGCPYSCVTVAPHAFAYSHDTGCARAISQGIANDSLVQNAAGQCPRNCIFFVTPEQRDVLEELLASALAVTYYTIPEEAKILQSLIARANFVNNRFKGHRKRKSAGK